MYLRYQKHNATGLLAFFNHMIRRSSPILAHLTQGSVAFHRVYTYVGTYLYKLPEMSFSSFEFAA